jgi:hypothetical protein
MSEVENTVEVGHPITNMLMRQACAADMGASDHADAGGPELAGVAALVLSSGGLLTMDAHGANIECAPDADTVEGVACADQVDPLDEFLEKDLREQMSEVGHLVEGARDAIARRLEQFDLVSERTVQNMDLIIEVGGKLDLLLSHFGLINTGS